MNENDLCLMAASELATRLARREISAVELTRAVLARIDRLDPQLQSYLAVTRELAAAAAAAADAARAAGEPCGPLHGIPIAVKDLCDIRGVRTTCASGAFAAVPPATQDAAVVERLRAAGAVLLGKLNLTECALMGYHPSLPRPRNPWDPARDTGGSSSGPAAAVAAGLCFAALGTDTGGSIRMPAAWCGVVGLKPTYGRVSRRGVFPLSASLDHVGPIARRVRDAALMLDAIAGFDPGDVTSLREPPPRCTAAIGRSIRGMRIGYDRSFVAAGAQPAVAAAVEAALGVLASDGARIVDIVLPPCEAILPGWAVLCGGDALVAHAPTFPSRAAAYGPTFRSFLEYASTLSAADYAHALAARAQWNGALRDAIVDVDLLACPSAFMAAPPRELIDPLAPFDPAIAPFLRFTAPFNFSGVPTLSVPCGFSDEGLPYSLQLVGRAGDEPLLCAVGHAYETATPWHTRLPPICAE
jgi:amidase